MTKLSRTEEIGKRAASLMKDERWLDAIKLLSARSSGAGKNWKLSWNLGWCHFNLGRYDDARKHLIRANKLAPDNAICKWALGSVYLKKAQFRKAEIILADSLRLKESHLTRIALALAYLSQVKIAEAEKIHLENIKLRPTRSERYESYAAFLSDFGREAESQKILQKVKAIRSVN
jgi:tetratricopeptide (TPR) repeat protein